MLDADPLEVVSGDLDHKPELPILLDLLAEHEAMAYVRSVIKALARACECE